MSATDRLRRVPKVFVSYRSSDAPAVQRFADYLAAGLGLDAVFLDTRDIEGGELFPQRLSEEIRSSDLVIVAIGPDWEGHTDTARKLDRPDDWVRWEVRTALAAEGVVVLPVLVDRAAFPADLPSDLATLDGINAVGPVRTSHFDRDAAEVLTVVWTAWLRLAEPVYVLVSGDDAEAELEAGAFATAMQRVHPDLVLSVSQHAAGLRSYQATRELAEREPVFAILVTAEAAEDEDFVARVAALLGSRQVRNLALISIGVPLLWDRGVGQFVGEGAKELIDVLSSWTGATPVVVNLHDSIANSGSALSAIGALATGAAGIAAAESASLFAKLKALVVARPRVALIAGALAVGGVGAAAVTANAVLTSGPSDFGGVYVLSQIGSGNPFDASNPFPAITVSLRNTGCEPDTDLVCGYDVMLDGAAAGTIEVEANSGESALVTPIDQQGAPVDLCGFTLTSGETGFVVSLVSSPTGPATLTLAGPPSDANLRLDQEYDISTEVIDSATAIDRGVGIPYRCVDIVEVDPEVVVQPREPRTISWFYPTENGSR